MLTLRRAECPEFDARPGQYSRMRFSSDQVTGTVFPHLNMPFLPNSKFIYKIVLVGKQTLQSISTFLYNIEVASHVKNCHSGHYIIIIQFESDKMDKYLDEWTCMRTSSFQHVTYPAYKW